MKKIIAIILSVCLCLCMFTGCGDSDAALLKESGFDPKGYLDAKEMAKELVIDFTEMDSEKAELSYSFYEFFEDGNKSSFTFKSETGYIDITFSEKNKQLSGMSYNCTTDDDKDMQYALDFWLKQFDIKTDHTIEEFREQGFDGYKIDDYNIRFHGDYSFYIDNV